MYRTERTMLLRSIILVSLCAGLSYGLVYDYFTGNPATQSQLREYEAEGVTKICSMDIKPCDETERRRLDGTCNNPKYPARGTYATPTARILPANYHNGFYQRKAKSGNELPNVRGLRTHLLQQGTSSHPLFNHNVPGFGIHMYNDIGSIHDVENMLRYKIDCCKEEHMNDFECTPNIIPEDDPVFRYTNVRCMNGTRPLTFQSSKCTKHPVAVTIQRATSQYDCSYIYRVFNDDRQIRSFDKGQLIVEQEDGKSFPPNGPTAFCPNNVGTETRCLENHQNALLPISLYTVWFVRYHNFVASQLAEVNPCWDDDMLFYTAREINIATSMEMFMREWNSAIQGRDNLIKAGVMAEDGGFRDLYDPTKYPEVTMEYIFCLRWFHLIQESTAKLHDRHGNFIRDFPVVEATFRLGMLAQNNNMEYFTQSTFRAPCHAADGSVSDDIANRALANVQFAADAPAGDLNKGRHYGIAPYVDYVRHFYNINITSFEDLAVLIPKEKIERLEEKYECVEDVDLMAGLWVENLMEGGHIPLTLSKIMNHFFLMTISGDRHWYEREDRPYAFTKAQLQEIRKATLAFFMCSVGDGVIEIPKHAFLIISPENPIVSCSEIEKIDFSAWADDTCNKS